CQHPYFAPSLGEFGRSHGDCEPHANLQSRDSRQKTSLLEDSFHRQISQARPSYDRRGTFAWRVSWRLSRNATAREFPPPSDLGTRLREGNRSTGWAGYW